MPPGDRPGKVAGDGPWGNEEKERRCDSRRGSLHTSSTQPRRVRKPAGMAPPDLRKLRRPVDAGGLFHRLNLDGDGDRKCDLGKEIVFLNRRSGLSAMCAVAGQLDSHPALTSISMATSVTLRFSLATVMSSNRTASRIAFNFATRAHRSCCNRPGSRSLTRSCITSRLAVTRQTVACVAEVYSRQSSS